MNFFDCEHYCLNYYTKEGGWCSGMVSSNGHTTWCTALPEGGGWDEITNGDNDNIGSPYISNYGIPACNQCYLDWAVHIMLPNKSEMILPCFYSDSKYQLKEPVTIDRHLYNHIRYRIVKVENEGYYLEGDGPPIFVILLSKHG
jgi:hypothetical protein